MEISKFSSGSPLTSYGHWRPHWSRWHPQSDCPGRNLVSGHIPRPTSNLKFCSWEAPIPRVLASAVFIPAKRGRCAMLPWEGGSTGTQHLLFREKCSTEARRTLSCPCGIRAPKENSPSSALYRGGTASLKPQDSRVDLGCPPTLLAHVPPSPRPKPSQVPAPGLRTKVAITSWEVTPTTPFQRAILLFLFYRWGKFYRCGVGQTWATVSGLGGGGAGIQTKQFGWGHPQKVDQGHRELKTETKQGSEHLAPVSVKGQLAPHLRPSVCIYAMYIRVYTRNVHPRVYTQCTSACVYTQCTSVCVYTQCTYVCMCAVVFFPWTKCYEREISVFWAFDKCFWLCRIKRCLICIHLP